jgi:integrase
MAKVLTAAAVEKIKPKAARQEIPDARIQGLYLVVQPSGAKSWAVRYRLNGRPAKFTLGKYPRMELGAARAKAGAVLEQVAKGIDPAAQKRTEQAAPSEPDTFARIADDYERRGFPSRKKRRDLAPRTKEEYRRQLGRLKARWGKRLITEISQSDVEDVLDKLTDAGKPVEANRTHALARKLFRWCLQRRLITASPVDWETNEEKPRQRKLSDDEIRMVWDVFEQMGYPFGRWMQIALLTLMRRAEVATMRWPDLDLDQALWRVPATKGDKPHIVPLPAMAVAILKGLPRFKGPFVFTTTGGERPISGFSVAKKRADRLIANSLAQRAQETGAEPEPMPHWTPHDLRRTARSNLSRLRVPPHVAELVLAHAVGGIQAVYDVYDYLDERRHALESWAALLSQIIVPPDNVVPMRRA